MTARWIRFFTSAKGSRPIGIGAGRGTDAQVLVINDLLGLNEKVPKFAKAYTDLRKTITTAVEGFVADVETGAFPDEEHTYS